MLGCTLPNQTAMLTPIFMRSVEGRTLNPFNGERAVFGLAATPCPLSVRAWRYCTFDRSTSFATLLLRATATGPTLLHGLANLSHERVCSRGSDRDTSRELISGCTDGSEHLWSVSESIMVLLFGDKLRYT